MTSLSQRLSALHAERGHLVGNYEATLQPSLDENRDLSDIETEALGAVQERIETVDRQIERLSAAEALLARQAAPITYSYPGDRPGTAVVLRAQRERSHIQMQRRDPYKGADFTRFAIAVSVAGQWNAAEYARQRWGDDEFAEAIQRALWLSRVAVPPMGSGEPLTPGAGGSALVRVEHLAAEFIEMLRPLLIVARLPNMRRLEFDAAGTLLIPRQSGGVAGGYVGEGGTITVNRLAFEQLRLVPSKLAVIVPTTNELLHRADPGIEQLIRDDMLQGTARTVDRFFFSLRSQGASPAGILFGRPQNVDGHITASDPAEGVTVTDATDALKAMILALRMQNVPMLAPVWIMNARTKEFLRLLRTTQEIFAFKAELDAGTLLGYPVIDTTNIPIPFPPGAGQQTAYALIDASQLIWAEDMLPMIDASEHAAIWSDSGDLTTDPGPPPNPTLPGGPWGAGAQSPPLWSAFQNDLVLMRIRMRHTWNRRHDVAVTWALTDE